MRFKDFLLQEVGTSTGDIAGFRRISLPLTRRMWPPNIAAMVSENPPEVPSKKKKPMMQPQVKENFEELNSVIIQYLQRSGTAEISDMARGLDPSMTFEGQEGWNHQQGHHESPFNQALIALVKGGQVKVDGSGWGAPKFSLA